MANWMKYVHFITGTRITELRYVYTVCPTKHNTRKPLLYREQSREQTTRSCKKKKHSFDQCTKGWWHSMITTISHDVRVTSFWRNKANRELNTSTNINRARNQKDKIGLLIITHEWLRHIKIHVSLACTWLLLEYIRVRVLYVESLLMAGSSVPKDT